MRFVGKNHSENARLILYNMFHVPLPGIASYASWLQHLPIPQIAVDQLARSAENWGLSDFELRALDRRREFLSNGGGYLALQSTRVSRAFPMLLTPCTQGTLTDENDVFVARNYRVRNSRVAALHTGLHRGEDPGMVRPGAYRYG